MAGEGTITPSSDPTTWLAPGAGTSFVVRITETGRELRFVGPGDVRPCFDDVVVVASGTVVAMPSGGESPGDGQWLATPCGTFRWIAGAHKITVGTNECVAQTTTGTLFFTPAVGTTVAPDASALDGGVLGRAALGADGAWRLDARSAVRVKGRLPFPSAPAVAEATQACRDAEHREARLAERIRGLDGGSLASVGDLTAQHVGARRAARSACVVPVARAAGAAYAKSSERGADAGRGAAAIGR